MLNRKHFKLWTTIQVLDQQVDNMAKEGYSQAKRLKKLEGEVEKLEAELNGEWPLLSIGFAKPGIRRELKKHDRMLESLQETVDLILDYLELERVDIEAHPELHPKDCDDESS